MVTSQLQEPCAGFAFLLLLPQGDIWVDAVVLHSDAATSGGDGGGSGASLAVSVHDTGIGIPDNKRDDIFDPFAQVGVCVWGGGRVGGWAGWCLV